MTEQTKQTIREALKCGEAMSLHQNGQYASVTESFGEAIALLDSEPPQADASAEAFEAAYRPIDSFPAHGRLTFGDALVLLKQGKKLRRAGWNGKGMFLAIQEGSTIDAEAARGGVARALAEQGEDAIKINDHIDMKAADGSVVVGWLASQTDMLAEDWELAE